MENGEKCNNNDCNSVVIEKRRKDGKYKKYCSLSCQRLCVKNNMEKTCLEKYGVKNASSLTSTKDKIKNTNLERYGVENPSLVPEFIAKIKATNIQRYGTDKPQLLDICQEKNKRSCLEKYGIEKPQRLDSFKDKSKATCQVRYGVDAPQQDEDIQQKSIDTCMEKYGVSNPSQDPTIYRKQRGMVFRLKEFEFPSGRIDKVQGYEPLALKKLLSEGHTEKDIVTDPINMPLIWYMNDNKNHKYFPDIYLPKEDLIIEVKSIYTFNVDKSVNLLKKQACIDAGHKFKFMIFNGRHNLVDLDE